ncbi:STM4013/SEN3800 family hydrolase [Escherichia fergusonii]|uniref:Metal-dependent hydrolase n=1 Tax=Escherichia fergusonii (strain ATCC 35469 / DSM 13698 / CCUG 18766 / IAM 14443 / JCM 21226 / LMG 7866 / NBRC 102419 / NCTC 12128 / CDC 0568-73) TaxID=585054 RepID=B7LVG7_ESCF3|nr:STM4013/SEN3800 family hydrolase [Escherichia fergusonii]EHT2455056.1 STM4013/SEN3800 family hydrolase [Escherichia fergusonii]EIH2137740.1 STM4013/SEN3800 family hydrolase [Escherichia fergusonii]EIH2157285.1 STM4013/SEN3800 family hydrolase [Escherichia fergusonii]EIH9410935.1 STM4013/SEN3800 family hydrolase [Escherichia fergusonii]EIH9430910.1 STM4013/SEN3800 family hydrolase [Escherichia fergusonii]
MYNVTDEVPENTRTAIHSCDGEINMNDLIAREANILFVVLDSLRFDIAFQEQEAGNTPNINRYGRWIKCEAAGNFTWPSHHSMFSGFMPKPLEAAPGHSMLFFPKDIGLGRLGPKNAFAFSEDTWIKGLENKGYRTICVGGVSFFNNRSGMGKVFPAMFKESYWYPNFSCTVKESMDNQLTLINKKVNAEQPLMMYINIDTIHYPNHFYIENAKPGDTVETHAAALHYIDARIEKLFDTFRQTGRETLVILCSDHGTCYGEDGKYFHSFNHPIVNTVPYFHFVLDGKTDE